MADKGVKIVLTLDGKQYSAELQRAGAQMQQFGAQVTGASASASAGVKSVADGLLDVGAASAGAAQIPAVLNQTALSARQAGQAVSAIPQQLQGVAAQFQTTRTGLAGIAAQANGLQTSVLGAMAPARALADTLTSTGAKGAAGLAQADKQTQALGLSARQTAAAMRGVPAQITDIVTSLQGGQAPMTVFLQQGGQLKDMFGGAVPAARALGSAVVGMINPFTVLAATAGVAMLAYQQGSSEADAYRSAIVMSGNAAGTSVGQLSDMARAISQVSGTQGAAAATLAQMAGSGAIARENLQQFSAVAMDLEKYVGVPVKATVQDLEQLGKAPLAASIKLNEQYHYLTESVYAQIKALDEQGRKEEAGAAAQKAYASAMEARKNEIVANLGDIERGWNAVTSAAKKGWDAILNIGREDTSQQKLDDTGAKIAKLREQLAKDDKGGFSETGGGAAVGIGANVTLVRRRAELEMLLQQQAALQESVRLEQRGAEAAAQRAKEGAAAAEWGKIVTANKSKEKQQEEEILRIRNAGKAAGKEQVEIEREIAAYKARTADKGVSGAASRELERQRSLLAELAGLSGDFYKEWESLTKQFQQGKISQEDLVRLQSVLLAKQPAMVAAAKEEQHLLEQRARAWQEIQRTQERAQQQALEALQRGAKAAEQQVQRLQEEEAAASLAASANIPLAEAVERVALARAEDNYQKALGQAADGATLLALQKEIDARREIVGLVRGKETREGIKKTADEADKELKRVTDQYEQGLTNAAMQGGKSLKEYVLGMLRTTAFRIVLDPVMKPLAGLLAGTLGSTAGTSGAGGVDGLASLVNSGSSIYSALTNGISGSIGSAFAKFAGSSVGQTLGLSNPAAILGNNPSAFVPAGGQLTSLGSSIGSGLGMLGNGFAGYGISSALSGGYSAGKGVNAIAGIASAIPGIGPIAGVIGGLINRAFGRKLADMGIEGTLGGSAGFEGSAYKFYKGGWLRSDKTKRQDLDSATATGLADSFKAIQGQVGAFATALGLQTDKIAGFTTQLKVSTKGLDEAGIAQAFQEALATGSNELAQQVLGTWTHVTQQVTDTITSGGWDDRVTEQVTRTVDASTYAASEYAKTGEKAIDTLSRLAGSFTTVNTLSDAMGYGFHQASLAGAAAASNLVDAFGGLEAFTATLGAYVQNYYSDEEQRSATARQASRALADAGLDFSAQGLLAATRPQIRAFVEGVAEQFGFESSQYVAAVQQANVVAAITQPLASATQTMAAASAEAAEAMREWEAAQKAIADERKGLQAELDELTMTRVQLLDKERAAIHANNQALWDEVQAARTAKEAADARKAIQEELDQLTLSRVELLARERAAMAEGNRALWDSLQLARELPAAIDKFLSPQQREQTQYSRIAADLGAAGIQVPVQALIGASKEEIAQAAAAIYLLAETSDEARLAVVRAAGALADLKDSSVVAQQRKSIQDELDQLTLTRVELIEREREAISEGNRALWDRLQAVRLQQQLAQELPAVVDKYLTPEQRTRARYDRVAADLGEAGLHVPVQALIGASKEEIAQAAIAIYNAAETSDAMRLALLRAAGALADLKDEAALAAKELHQKTLETLQSQADAALGQLERAIRAEKDAIAQAAQARIEGIEAELQAHRAAQQAASEALAGITRIVDTLGEGVRNLRGQVQSTALAELASSRAFIAQSAAGATATGALPDADALERALQSVTRDDRRRYASMADWDAAQLDTANQLEAIEQVGGRQKDIAERHLEAATAQGLLLEERLRDARKQADAAQALLDAQLANARERLEVLRGSDLKLQSIAQATAGFDAALAAVGQQIALATYQGAAMVADRIGALVAARESPKTNIGGSEGAGMASYAVGTNYVPHDQVALIHEGEAIVPKRYNPAAQGSGAWPRANTIARRLQTGGAPSEVAFQSALHTLTRAMDRLTTTTGETRDAARRTRDVLEAATRGQAELGVRVKESVPT